MFFPNLYNILLYSEVNWLLVKQMIVYTEKLSVTSDQWCVGKYKNNHQWQRAQHFIYFLSHMAHKDLTRHFILISRVLSLLEGDAIPLNVYIDLP